MRRWVALAGFVVVVAGCSGEAATTTTSMSLVTTTTSLIATTTTTTSSTTTTASPPGGYLVRLDMETLRPVSELEPIPIGSNSWNLFSRDGSVLVHVECDEVLCDRAMGIDVDAWRSWDPVDVGWHAARTADGLTFYGYDERGGSVGRGLFSVDLVSGEEVQLAEWRDSLYFWDDLHVLPSGVIAGLAPESSDVFEDRYAVYVYDPASGEEEEIPVGPLGRSDEHSGVFDGEYEIPIYDSPGVAWGDDQVFIANAEDLEVTRVDLTTGSVDTREVDTSSWLDRLLAFWMPSASAKGPSMGTYSSATLSPDGRYLFISGNRMDVETQADGSLIEVQEHLGLTVVDTDTWRVVPSPDLNIQFVHNFGGRLIGVDTRVGQSGIEDYYLLEIDEDGLSHRGPFTTSSGGCVSTPHGRPLLCVQEGRAELIDPETAQPTAELNIGYEDTVHGFGVLEDWIPSVLP